MMAVMTDDKVVAVKVALKAIQLEIMMVEKLADSLEK
jgi:hypothetical protein